MEEAIAVLTSREFTERFIVQNQILPQLYPAYWDTASGAWRDGVAVPTPTDGYREFHKYVRTLVRDRKTGLVTLQIDWRDPATAARWANDQIELLNREMRDRAIAHADRSLKFLRKELERTEVVETRQAINRLTEAQINQKMLADVNPEYVFRVVGQALPPDRDDIVRPRPALMALLGAVAALFIAVLVVGFSAARRARGPE